MNSSLPRRPRLAAVLRIAAPLLVAAASYVAANLVASAHPLRNGAEATPGHVVRLLARPFVLPFVWRAMRDAQLRGSPGEWVTHGRTLVRLLPEWTDAHVHVAWRLAFDEGIRAGGWPGPGGEPASGRNGEPSGTGRRDPEAALSRLLAALAVLQEALGRGNEADAQLLTAMAAIVQIRTRQDPAVAAAFRTRVGSEPAAMADHYLQRAERLLPSAALSERRTILMLDLVAAALRAHDTARAASTLDLAMERLANLRDAELAGRWLHALARLREWLRSEGRAAGRPTFAELAGDPMLDRLVEAMRTGGYR